MTVAPLPPGLATLADERGRPHDIVDDVLERLAARAGDVAFISLVDRASLHARADELELLRRRGVELPLYGVPFAVKDNIDVAGLPTTAGCPAFTRYPDRDAHCVRRLLDAGAIVVGKTNLDQFATGLTGTRSPFGVPESVFGQDLISGGSSSGSAVAVASGTVAFALGTDTAGSGRVPAAMNGVVGLKPTRGLVGTTGMLPACRSLDCVSVFTRDVVGAAALLPVLAGPDPDDPWSRTPHVSEWYDGALRLALADGLDFAGDAAMAAAFAAVAARAADHAIETVRVPVEPLVEVGDLLYAGPWVAERLAGLEPFVDAHPDDVLPVIRAVLERGRDFTGVDAFRARHRLQELRAGCSRIWERSDVLLLPTLPTTFTRAQIAEEPIARNLVLGRYTQSANLLDLAAIAVPAGTTADGRPIGVTLLGPAFSEARLLPAALALFPPEEIA
ncbi:MAG: Allophanate hydrolase [Pseudonocardia sp.]|nr:Allophanate hydrolase [Pseudonocardia sp.]